MFIHSFIHLPKTRFHYHSFVLTLLIIMSSLLETSVKLNCYFDYLEVKELKELKKVKENERAELRRECDLKLIEINELERRSSQLDRTSNLTEDEADEMENQWIQDMYMKMNDGLEKLKPDKCIFVRGSSSADVTQYIMVRCIHVLKSPNGRGGVLTYLLKDRAMVKYFGRDCDPKYYLFLMPSKLKGYTMEQTVAMYHVLGRLAGKRLLFVDENGEEM